MNHKIINYCTFFILLNSFVTTTLFAQESDTLEIYRDSSMVIRFAKFKQNNNRTNENEIAFLKQLLNAGNLDNFVLISEKFENETIKHRKFQHYYNGIPVEASQFIIHSSDSKIEIANGNFIPFNSGTTTPTLSETGALQNALQNISATKYKWQDPTNEAFIKTNSNNPNATYYPIGELVMAKDYLHEPKQMKLAWKFIISTSEPEDDEFAVYIDAANGAVLNSVSLVQDGNTPTQAQTTYSGTQNMIVDQFGSEYRLRETNRSGTGVEIRTLNMQGGFDISKAIDFTNQNKFTSQWASNYYTATEAHWGAEMLIDFLKSKFNRNSLDDNGLTITSGIYAGHNWSNARWYSGVGYRYVLYGRGDRYDFTEFTSLDDIGHELGHGLNEFTADFSKGTNRKEAATITSIVDKFNNDAALNAAVTALPLLSDWVTELKTANNLFDTKYVARAVEQGAASPDTIRAKRLEAMQAYYDLRDMINGYATTTKGAVPYPATINSINALIDDYNTTINQRAALAAKPKNGDKPVTDN